MTQTFFQISVSFEGGPHESTVNFIQKVKRDISRNAPVVLFEIIPLDCHSQLILCYHEVLLFIDQPKIYKDVYIFLEWDEAFKRKAQEPAVFSPRI